MLQKVGSKGPKSAYKWGCKHWSWKTWSWEKRVGERSCVEPQTDEAGVPARMHGRGGRWLYFVDLPDPGTDC